MSRVDGRKVVGVAVLGITACMGVAQVYVPFFMDRDALAGRKNVSKEEQRAQLALMQQEARKQQGIPTNNRGISGANDNNSGEGEITPSSTRSPGSMWKNIRGKQ
mmetsp:Transcript_31663/g.46700  ORF Transcript_31663/g.46700 Transcript_31663/m.46700 type:complete len:105 (+) Transcript_31663:121-435(+)|eukprot:CAMPEP_0195515366 /NCGR_PEP_ID=MMETSP0794_2-20130614/6454_1 /TAXON_ID=515487 /ORGANISM="Stephanopyxis turris, Strain CCMP 815" /LENGTH=104 /DNA_ID=CAMNT_0040643769 /DNA_START=112 /DNA_END=426 /DNA_ORIENTATION=-